MTLPSSLPGSSSVTALRRSRRRRCTVGAIDGWTPAAVASSRFDGYSKETRRDGVETWGSSSESSSLYGMIGDDQREVRFVGLRRRRSKRSKIHAPTVQTRSLSARDETLLDDKREGKRIEYSMLEAGTNYAAEISLDESSSARSSTFNSVQSSPSQSECESDGKHPDSWNTCDTWECSLGLPLSLSPRHTDPARKHLRSTSLTLTLITSPVKAADTCIHYDDYTPASSILFGTFPPLTLSATTLTALLFLLESTSLRIIPSSPIHLLRDSNNPVLEYLNAALSPFSISSSISSLTLALVNLSLLRNIELAVAPLGIKLQCCIAGLIWTSIVAVRVTLAWLFGRVLGWAHPSLLSTPAIHEVGSGLAPFILSVQIMRASRGSSFTPHLLQIALLAANFSTPIENGGTGFWWGASAVIVGLFASILWQIARSCRDFVTPPTSPSRAKITKTSYSVTVTAFLALIVIPLLATMVTTPVEPIDIAASFATLHPDQPYLLTILLLTAPRPGNPDYLFQTIESWLNVLPVPSPSDDVSDRIRLIVYTHFGTHEIFDSAQAYFTTSSTHASKASQYLHWHRDPRGGANRLDQRLHVARGLEYAVTSAGESAYVMLAEDDFPLCSDDELFPTLSLKAAPSTWDRTWEEIVRMFVATNLAMPDLPSSHLTSKLSLADQEVISGHCGIFLATGGSGLAIRGFLAAKLPALLLGEDDSHGDKRDLLAERGEIWIKVEDEGADTPDLVIQDCLRGLLPGCEMCAPSTSQIPRKQYPLGSKRNPFEVNGDRWGKSGLVATEKLMQHHLGFNSSTLPGRHYGQEEWACGWRQPFNGEPDVFIL